MKIHIFLALVLSCVGISCQGPKTILANQAICYYDTTIVDEEMSFNIAKYDSLLTFEWRTIASTSEYYDSSTISQWSHDHSIVNRQTNRSTSIEKFISYTPEGKLMEISFFYDDVEIGKSIHFNENGSITEIFDHDKGYKVCWAQALEIAKKLASRDLARDNLRYVDLSRKEWKDVPDFRPQWEVTIATDNRQEPPNYKKKQKVYVLDGVTGKLIRTYTFKTIP